MNSIVLDVAIGMAFVYLLLSLIASVVQEILATFMQLRSANLERALRSLFSGDKIGSGLDLVESIYDHGLVRGLYRDPVRDAKLPPFLEDAKEEAAAASDQLKAAKAEAAARKLAFKGAQRNDPSLAQLRNDYSKSQAALEDAVRRLRAKNAAVKVLNGSVIDALRHGMRRLIGLGPEKQLSKRVVSNSLLLPAYIPSATFAETLIDVLNTEGQMGKAAMESITRLLQSHQLEFEGNKASQALLALALKSEGRLATFQQEIENWYNAAMDRASGWYKRYTQQILLATGLILAVTFNVDSIRVAQTLWTDRDVRQGMVSAAGDYMKNHPQTDDSNASNSPATSNSTPKGSDAPEAQLPDAKGAENSEFDAGKLKARMNETVTQFNEVAKDNLLPVGWKHSPFDKWSGQKWPERMKYIWDEIRTPRTWALLLGWGMTAMAISLGAPFWFDTLNRFMVVRGTVKPAEKSKNEASKD